MIDNGSTISYVAMVSGQIIVYKKILKDLIKKLKLSATEYGISTMLKYFFSVVLIFILSSPTWAQTRVVGYIPTYKGLTASINGADLSKLTHLNIAFINPDKSGDLFKDDHITCMQNETAENVLSTDLHYTINKAHQAGVKVLVSMAGALITSCSGDWANLLQAKNRNKLVDNIIDFVDKFNLDGIDIDIEGALLTKIDKAGNYTPFISKLSEKLKKQGKLLTCATASYEGGMIPISSIDFFDFINIMSYDAIGPSWGSAGTEHSTYQQAASHINIWKERGLAKDKLVLGVPFYGYGFGRYSGTYSFDDVLAKFGNNVANSDLIGNACADCNYITYNGLVTIKAKTKLALQEGSGVMIWELTHDTTGSESLLTAIIQEIEGNDH